MSRIADIGPKYEKLPIILAEYEKALEPLEGIIQIKGKTISEANRENASWQLYFDHKKVELATLTKLMEAQVGKIRGQCYRHLSENSKLDLSDRAKDKYIDNEKQYLDMYEIYLEVEEMYKKYQAACDAFQTRGYNLNNLTKIHVASLENVMA